TCQYQATRSWPTAPLVSKPKMPALTPSIQSKSPTPPRQSGLPKVEGEMALVTFVGLAALSGQEKMRAVVVLTRCIQYIVCLVLAPYTGVHTRWPSVLNGQLKSLKLGATQSAI